MTLWPFDPALCITLWPLSSSLLLSPSLIVSVHCPLSFICHCQLCLYFLSVYPGLFSIHWPVNLCPHMSSSSGSSNPFFFWPQVDSSHVFRCWPSGQDWQWTIREILEPGRREKKKRACLYRLLHLLGCGCGCGWAWGCGWGWGWAWTWGGWGERRKEERAISRVCGLWTCVNCPP